MKFGEKYGDAMYTIPVLVRSFTILDVLAQTQGLTADEIQMTTGFPRSTIYRILRTLVVLQQIRRGHHGRFYRARQDRQREQTLHAEHVQKVA